MAKYHINPETGNANVCHAKKRCRFQREGEPPVAHYPTKEEAQAAYEKAQGKVLPSWVKKEEQELTPLAKRLLSEVEVGFLGEKLSKEEVEAYAPLVFKRWAEVEKHPPNARFAVMAAQALYKQRRRKELIAEAAATPATVTYEALPEEREELAYYNKTFAEVRERMTPEEEESLHSYTGLLFERLNKRLRGELSDEEVKGEGAVAHLQTAGERLDSFITKAPPWRRDIPLYRVLTQDMASRGGPLLSASSYAEALGLQEGAVVTFPAYSSTTLDPAYVASFTQDDAPLSVVLRFSTTQGAPVQEATPGPASAAHYVQDREREVLLPRNSSFKVVGQERATYTSPSSHLSSVEVLTIHLEEA